jgi:queuine tRNA-ribosyltransferase
LLSFRLRQTDSATAARRGCLTTPHGDVETPAFMPVGTRATVKGLVIDQVRATGAQMLLANTYHLLLRPGEHVIEALGGLHTFMGWDGPILTDSGGYQIYSLAKIAKITEEGAAFRSHLDGSLVQLSPERAVQIQEALGSDIAMVLDHVVGLPSPPEALSDAVERTLRWADRCQRAHRRSGQALFGIVQGGLDVELRLDCTRRLTAMDFPGYAVGGLAVGETPAEMYKLLDETVAALPAEKPRYLMGVGRPVDLLEAIARGIDMFDCVLPTRNGRNALAFCDGGNLRLRNQQYERDPRPLEENCPCLACRHSRAYIRHLFMTGEMLGPILLTIHNLTYYQRLMAQARTAIEQGRFVELRAASIEQQASR